MDFVNLIRYAGFQREGWALPHSTRPGCRDGGSGLYRVNADFFSPAAPVNRLDILRGLA
jgi:hypothetical protein